MRTPDRRTLDHPARNRPTVCSTPAARPSKTGTAAPVDVDEPMAAGMTDICTRSAQTRTRYQNHNDSL